MAWYEKPVLFPGGKIPFMLRFLLKRDRGAGMRYSLAHKEYRGDIVPRRRLLIAVLVFVVVVVAVWLR